MSHPSRFLTAEWKNLVMLNYAVDPSLLERFVPAGTELDSFDGKTYVSVIGFEFKHTRILGFAAPFHQTFEEVNLRFYVRRGSRRGAVFIRELVPRRAVAAIARFAFNENYSYVPMSHRIELSEDKSVAEAEYAWGSEPNKCSVRLATQGAGFLPEDGSLSQFITEHYWGYAAQRDGGSLEYEVQHPQWRVQNARQATLSGNLVGIYGAQMTDALKREPDSAFLAEGSAVTVFKGTKIS